MTRELSAREHFRAVWKAADEVAERGFWTEAKPIGNDVNEHILTMLSVLVGGDGQLTETELELFNDVFAEVLGRRESYSVLRALLRERAGHAQVLLDRAPAFFQAIVRADVASDTHKSEEVFASLQELGRIACAIDRDIARHELSVLTGHMWALRRVMESAGLPEAGADGKGKSGDAKQGKPEETLEQLQAQLHRLVGLQKVKQRVDTLINTIRVRQLRQKHNLPVPPISFHMVFTGNPGTGKTTVARLMSKILKKAGVLRKGHIVEVDRSGLVAGFVGQTALKVNERVQTALGGVLFIDEAYALVVGRGAEDFGHEAVDVLVKSMEDNRDNLIVIVAGYPREMREFVDSNPGLRSRFSTYIEFQDYGADEMQLIFERMCQDQGYTLTPAAQERAKELFSEAIALKTETFANARDVRNLFEETLTHHANRLASIAEPTQQDLVQLEAADLPPSISSKQAS
jgi:SpoVK/Ycf46/Vps4 family AAA+-type ATPase